jgi:N6-adenosine-specific RNA methylase IME4
MIDQWASEYSCISADPPWPERGGGKIKRGCDRHYKPITKKEQIRDVMLSAPCWRPAARSHLWLWVTNNYLPWAMWLMPELGFDYKTLRPWVKAEEMEMPDCDHTTADEAGRIVYKPQRAGLGQYMRHDNELLLFGTHIEKGLKALRAPKGTPKPTTTLYAPRSRVHSQKPELAYREMELVSPSIGPRLEMFAGPEDRPGWDMWRPMVHR